MQTSLPVPTQSSNIYAAASPGVPFLAESGQYLSFMLGREVFAIDILSIREIIQYEHLTEVPMMPSSVRGVINVRGSALPVIDLPARLGMATACVTRRTCIVIVEASTEGARRDIGLIVDAVNEVLDIARRDIEPPPVIGARASNDFIKGMGKVASRFVMLLDVDRLVSVDEQETACERKGDVAPQETSALAG